MRKRYFDLRPGDSVSFGGSIVTAEAKTGQRLRLCVETDGEIVKQREGEQPIQRPAAVSGPKTGLPPPTIPRPMFKPQ